MGFQPRDLTAAEWAWMDMLGEQFGRHKLENSPLFEPFYKAFVTTYGKREEYQIPEAKKGYWDEWFKLYQSGERDSRKLDRLAKTRQVAE